LVPLVEAGQFRQDLFFRLHVLEINMPSLREMREDIPLIAHAILEKLARGRTVELTGDAIAALQHYPFPGNVRELENILERGLSLAAQPSQIRAGDLYLTPVADNAPRKEIAAAVVLGEGEIPASLETYLDDVERAALLAALERTRFNRTEAAKLLGITFRAMRYRMARLGIK
jgi:two-component system response regulator PilR (NtrC family)